MKIVFLFTGQGSHYRGMGQKLFNSNPVFRQSLEESDGMVRKQLNRSLIEELYVETDQTFDDLLITHPSIVAIEIAMYRVMQSMGIKPDYVNGNSLGEFAAGVVSGIWKAETALEAAIEQAKAIVRSEVEGGMLAVMNAKRSELEDVYHKHDLHLASDNFSEHFTLSGPSRSLDSFQTEMKGGKATCLRLPVAVPFHSPLIEKGKGSFVQYMETLPELGNPAAGFISGMESAEVRSISRNYFWDVTSRYTNFPKMVECLENQGPCLYIDLGPSGTSATFVKYNLKPGSKSQVHAIMTPFKREEQQLESLKKLFFEQRVI